MFALTPLLHFYTVSFSKPIKMQTSDNYNNHDEDDDKTPDDEGPIQTEELPQVKECRICLDSTGTAEEFVAPCRCAGSMKYVHRGCLAEWMRRANNPANREMCPTCR